MRLLALKPLEADKGLCPFSADLSTASTPSKSIHVVNSPERWQGHTAGPFCDECAQCGRAKLSVEEFCRDGGRI